MLPSTLILMYRQSKISFVITMGFHPLQNYTMECAVWNININKKKFVKLLFYKIYTMLSVFNVILIQSFLVFGRFRWYTMYSLHRKSNTILLNLAKITKKKNRFYFQKSDLSYRVFQTDVFRRIRHLKKKEESIINDETKEKYVYMYQIL